MGWSSRRSGSRASFDPLISRDLSSIEFVRDYMQFRFDGPTLTVLNDPKIYSTGNTWSAGSPGYRDTLVELIGKRVQEIRFRDARDLVVVFDGDATLVVPLDAESRQGRS